MSETTPIVAEPGDRLADGIGQTQRRLRRVLALVSTGTLALGTLVYVLLFVIADHQLQAGVPAAVRAIVVGLYYLSATAWLASALITPLLRHINDAYVARLIERSHPEFRNSVISAVQLARHEELPGTIRSAVIEQAAHDLAEINPRRAVDTRAARLLGGAVLGIILLFAAYSGLTSKPMIPSVLRAFGLNMPAPTRTQLISVSPGEHTVVLRGTPIRFAARTSGAEPDSVIVRFSHARGDRWLDGQQLTMARGSTSAGLNHQPSILERLFSRTRHDDQPIEWQAAKAGVDVQQSMYWQITAGDAVSAVGSIEVRPAPAIAVREVQYDYPAHTGRPPTTQPGGLIEAVVGTRARIRAEANVPIRDAILVIGRPPNERRRVLSADAVSGASLSAELTVVEDSQYHIEFRDQLGNTNQEPIRYPILTEIDTHHDPEEVSVPEESAAEKPIPRPTAETPPPRSDQPGDSPEQGSEGTGEGEPSRTQKSTAEFTDAHARELETISRHLSNEAGRDQPGQDASSKSGEQAEPSGIVQPPPAGQDQERSQNLAQAPNQSQDAQSQAQQEQGQSQAQGLEQGQGQTQALPQPLPQAQLQDQQQEQGQGQELSQENGTGASPAESHASSSSSQQGNSSAADSDKAQADAAAQAGQKGGQESAGSHLANKATDEMAGQKGAPDSPDGQPGTEGQAGTSASDSPADSAGREPASSAGGSPIDHSADPAQVQSQPSQESVRKPDTPTANGPDEPSPGRLADLMDALERSLRAGNIDPAMLDELGWNEGQLRQFVESYKRTERPPGRNPDHTTPAMIITSPSANPMDDSDVQRADGAPAAGIKGMATIHQRQADSSQDVLSPGRQRVSPRYRRLLEGYYRAVTSRPAH